MQVLRSRQGKCEVEQFLNTQCGTNQRLCGVPTICQQYKPARTSTSMDVR